MTLEMSNKQKTHMQGKVRALRIQSPGEDPVKVNIQRERFLALLKSRYGYSNDKAVDELERLLTQFYRTNKSLGMHRPHPIFRHPSAR